MQVFTFVGFAAIKVLLFNQEEEKKKKKEKKKKNNNNNNNNNVVTLHNPVLQAFLVFFKISLAFNMFSTLVEVKLSGN